jgi:predicted esterase
MNSAEYSMQVHRQESRAVASELIDEEQGITRRRFAAITGGLVMCALVGDACRLDGEAAQGNAGRLSARPDKNAKTSAAGEHPLDLDGGSSRGAILQMPATSAVEPLPLMVFLHGAGGSASRLLARLGPSAVDAGVAVLAVDSRAATWDAIRGGFGPDVAFLNRALERVFQTVAVDPARVAVAGFSDGATYALSLGLINGDLFRRVIAFSPGFIVEADTRGKPRFFVSHGTADDILPIDRCSRRIVPALRQRGYDVTFREFDGGHEMPPAIAREGLAWLAAK